MSERKWTDAQLSAIEYRGKNLLVSAAAGSGKTATLTERVIRLITDEDICADVTRMLVVTFTNAAASELRGRVTAALGDASAKDPSNRRLADQLCRVGDASICTMDSFFLSCVRPMFDKVGLPAEFRIGDKAELDALREEAMEETVGALFDGDESESQERFLAIAEAIGSTRTEEGIDGILLDFEAEACRVGIGKAELYRYADELCRFADTDILDTPFGKCILDEILMGMKYYGGIFSHVAPIMAETPELVKSYVPAAYTLAEYCDRCVSAAESGDFEALRGLMMNMPKCSYSTKAHTEESLFFKDKYGEVKDFVKDMCFGYLSDEPSVRADVMRRTADICRGAGDIVEEFGRRYTELKKRRGITDHSDVAKMAAELLADENGEPTPYGKTVASRYDYVFIDEYQDTSIYQDRIFAAVASECGRFMVGDIKQSIYRFRGGEPAVFTGYRKAWTDGKEGSTVFMSENFRCSENVIGFVNAVSRYMFPHGHIPFEEGDLLIHGRQEPEGGVHMPVEVCLLERPGNQRGGASAEDISEITGETPEEIPSGAYIETEYVAKRIRHMLDHETLPDGKRIKPSDIAVMLREIRSRKDIISDVFDKYGIPINEIEERSLLSRPEILLMICILRAVDNPTRDIYLAGAMRSSVFGFFLEEIALIKNAYKNADNDGSLWDAVKYVSETEDEQYLVLREKCAKFCRILDEYRVLSENLTSAPFVYRLIYEPAVYYAIETEGGVGAIDRALQFYEIARGRDVGLYEFLEYLAYIEKSGLESKEKSSGEGVSVISVHHSKGLEFPVCFLMNATKRYNTNDLKKSMILDREFGVAMRLPDDTGLVKCDNHLRKLAGFRALRENKYEEMRVLYVAMTRARERLIVTGVTNSPEKLLGAANAGARFCDGFSVISKNSYMDIILEALNVYGGRFAAVESVPYYSEEDTAVSDCGTVAEADSENVADTVSAADISRILEDRFSFEYQHRHLQNIPSKLTVSKLYPEILDEFDDGSTILEVEEVREPSVPRFMMDSIYSPTDAGSAAHVFMQFCDFERLRDEGVSAELDRLVSLGFMSKAQGEAANLEYLERFCHSDFFRRILSAKEVHREFRFNAAMPASSFTGDEEKAEALDKSMTDVIVQGVIDIVFIDENDELVLADYKTDRLTDYELAHKSAASEKLWGRHGSQLRYYADVCEKIFGRVPDKVQIYSMPLGETV